MPHPSVPKFQIGDEVYKWTGDYTGPGIVRMVAHNTKGQVRYMVGHTIEGGTGELLHIYSEGNLRRVDHAVIVETGDD
jgi:hypothetical protein